MRIYGLVQDSIVDGPGWRFTCFVQGCPPHRPRGHNPEGPGPGWRFTCFVQGCPHHCPGCHNPESHDPHGGREMTVEEVAGQLLSNPLTDGLTLSGGEPFAQAEDCLALAKIAHAHGLNVWSWSGWTFEHLRDQGTDAQKALLAELDVLVDGPYLSAQRSLQLSWRGSRNQRVIDVPASLSAGEAVVRPD